MNTTEYIPEEVLAIRLGLPKTYVKRLVREHRIPYLKVGRWKRYDEQAVRQVLAKLAEADSKLRLTVLQGGD